MFLDELLLSKRKEKRSDQALRHWILPELPLLPSTTAAAVHPIDRHPNLSPTATRPALTT